MTLLENSAMATGTTKVPPSARWTSYDSWNYNGMKERLEMFMSTLNKSTLVQHAEHVMGQKYSISEPFSAGEYWACFELIAEDGNLVIARVRLPRHPDSADAVNEQSELYSITCEIATMNFLREKVTTVPFPSLYAYAGPGSQWATDAGAIYMLIEGFYGNTLLDIQFDICSLPISMQDHIIEQWTQVQAELATFTFPQIGSISSFSPTSGAVIGELSTAVADGLVNHGPFSDAATYFSTIGQATLAKLLNACQDSSSIEDESFATLGAFVFLDILGSTDLFTCSDSGEPFHFNHMDMGTQNILVDDNFNFLAVIDWEFAQSAPWQVNHYPMPFPLTSSDAESDEILNDPTHIAHNAVSKQKVAQDLYRQKFQDAESRLEKEGRPLKRSIAHLLDGEASRIYACLENLGGFVSMNEELTHEMVRLAYGFDPAATEHYLERLKAIVGWPLTLQLFHGQM